MESPLVYAQLQTPQIDKAKEFYTRLFGWQADQRSTPMGPYAEITAGGNRIAGIFGHSDVAKTSLWVPYFRVTDIKDKAEKAKTLGAKILNGPVQLPDKSWFCLMLDTTGATLGLHQLSTE